MQRDFESLFHCQILAWDDPEETPYVAVKNGQMILADSLGLLVQALTETTPHAYSLAA